jgi:hypothetical protein
MSEQLAFDKKAAAIKNTIAEKKVFLRLLP